MGSLNQTFFADFDPFSPIFEDFLIQTHSPSKIEERRRMEEMEMV